MRSVCGFVCGGSGLNEEKSLFIVCDLDLLVVLREEEEQQIVSKTEPALE